MSHRFAIIGWGSLIWDPRTLPHDGDWRPHGPTLAIEFCRVARDRRLTLAVHGEYGVPVTTYFALSSRRTLAEVVADVAEREQCEAQWISSVDAIHDESQTQIGAWCVQRGLAGAVWTGLESNFERRAGEPYSVAAALAYLDGLEGETKRIAHEYIRRAPSQTRTPLRDAYRRLHRHT